MTSYVLDACALVAVLKGENGGFGCQALLRLQPIKKQPPFDGRLLKSD